MRFWSIFLLLVLTSLPLQAQDKIVLFNGKDLDGWVKDGPSDYKDKDGTVKQVWSVNDQGHLFCDGKGFGFLRYDKKQFKDFTFHVEYKMQPKSNSGIGIRTTVFDPKKSTATRPSFYSYEIQLIDDEGKPANSHSTGSLYRYVAPSVNAHKKAGEWNTMEITCVGPKIKIIFNDQKIIDVDQTTIAEIKDKPLEGYLCVQNHGGKVEFKNLWVKEIK